MNYLSNDISTLSCLQSPLSSNPNPSSITSHHNHGMQQLLQDFLDHPPTPPRRPLKATLAPPPSVSSGLQDAAASLSLSRDAMGKVNNNNNNKSSFARSAPQQMMGPSARRAASSFLSPFEEGLAAPSPSTQQADNDPRRKRIMKNRESAARSRARRQAYTYELERERALLIEENARLRQKLREQDHQSASSAAAAVLLPTEPVSPPQQVPKKKRISRTISASF